MPDSANSPIQKQKVTTSLDDILLERLACLGGILKGIDEEARQRANLSGNIIHLIYQHYCYLKSKLHWLKLWPLSSDRAIESRRSALEKQLDALKQEKRQEQVLCWQDAAALRKEFRMWLKQYSDLMQRVKLVRST